MTIRACFGSKYFAGLNPAAQTKIISDLEFQIWNFKSFAPT